MGIQAECRECQAVRDKRRNYAKYGITESDYLSMLRRQGGRCAICGTTDAGNWKGSQRCFCIDHDHLSGKIRGILCSHCNMALGHFKDSIQNLREAVAYMEYYQE